MPSEKENHKGADVLFVTQVGFDDELGCPAFDGNSPYVTSVSARTFSDILAWSEAMQNDKQNREEEKQDKIPEAISDADFRSYVDINGQLWASEMHKRFSANTGKRFTRVVLQHDYGRLRRGKRQIQNRGASPDRLRLCAGNSRYCRPLFHDEAT